jgi:hypothetical protein
LEQAIIRIIVHNNIRKRLVKRTPQHPHTDLPLILLLIKFAVYVRRAYCRASTITSVATASELIGSEFPHSRPMKLFAEMNPLELDGPRGPMANDDTLKEWIWQNCKDALLAALTIKYEVEEEQPEEEKVVEISTQRWSLLDTIAKVQRRGRDLRMEQVSYAMLCMIWLHNKTIQHLLFVEFDGLHFACIHSFWALSDCTISFYAQPRDVFGSLLTELLQLMNSEYGFIGEVKNDEKGERFLQMVSCSLYEWTERPWC